jgi:hypothetical protein
MNRIKLFVLIFGLLFATSSYAFAVLISVAIYAAIAIAAEIAITTIVVTSIAMIASAVISKSFAQQSQASDGNPASASPNPGNNQQVPPTTDNKLPVVYGSAWLGGTITDLSITENNQQLYYVLALCEVTSTNSGQTPDTITFGDIYYGGKKVTFQGNGYTVASLTDESTGVISTNVNGRINIYLYSNGSNSPTNSSQSAISVMQSSGLAYTWDNTKLMSNCAFAIIQLNYSQSASITSLQQTKFQITNSRTNTGDCLYDYLINTRYGAAIPSAQIDTASLDALTTYSNQSFSYTSNTGGTETISRFKFDGVVDTNRTIMQNMQDMASCCDCIIKYNDIVGKWGVITQSPTYTIAMALNDSNIISGLTINPTDIASSYNIAEVKFPDSTNQDAFATATIDLNVVDPALLYPNEPINKQSISLPLVNNNVRAQYLANRFLKSAREDLQVQCQINFVGLQLEAGDVVTITNANYGWVAKLFRIFQVTQIMNDDASITVALNLSEFNPEVYDDTSITQFSPAPNTGIGSPTFFGALEAPEVLNQYPNATNPYFTIQARTSTAGITQYLEIWYSAYSNPDETQLYFAGTSEIQSNGNPYDVYTIVPLITLQNIPAGNWYFFSRMVNSLGSSIYSPASNLLQWRPSTYQFINKYLNIAYATSITGTGFSLNPRGKTYYGLFNTSSTSVSTNPADYTWYLAPSAFNTTGALIYLLYSNRTGRLFSFSTGFAAYAANTGAFVPTSTLVYDPSLWAGLPDGANLIDLDQRTGQIIQTGTTTVGTGEIAVTNNNQGNIVASLQQYLDFGGPYTKTSAVATLTVDIYGRIVGFEAPDDFNYTQQIFTATSGQTVFTVTRSSGYISGQCWVMKNGCLLDPSEYTDTSGSTGTVTLSVGATTGDIVTITSFKSVNATTGAYVSFSRNGATLTNQATYTASGFTLNTGFELLFLNGTIVNAQDYDISGQDITFIGNATGDLQVIQWTPNNLGVANGTPVNVDAFTVIGQTIYPFSYNINAFNLFSNGVLFKQGTDYTTSTGSYTLTNTPTTITNIMVQQTFSRTGAV